MTISSPLQKWIVSQRKAGYSYAEISRACNIPSNSIRTLCISKDIDPLSDSRPSSPLDPLPLCKHCGQPIVKIPGRKFRMFCSYECQKSYWSPRCNTPRLLSLEVLSCPICGNSFSAVPSHKRIYCSRKCYYISRSSAKDKLAIPSPQSDE